jgi:uncharacterized membrane protein YfcA
VLRLLLLIPMIVGGIIGSIIAGNIEDYITPQIQRLPDSYDCNSIEQESWKEQCEKVKSTTDKGITLFNLVGFVSGFASIGGLIKKIEDG